ncbi:hypothetical protein IB276_36130 [Ensifer sp. ENS04]|uniref:hypothetical protein n=1 Tax=Ensifer sp. ENS04 TaxID=2769281 RepID=UPI001782DAD2|nr:hypothetical protein [Ensifer sp. ENS04]MBD9544860.1 hypothetical protein [Ensifer sp. ENS04]
MDYVFNRASVAAKFPSVEAARSELAQLLEAMASIDAIQLDLPVFRLHVDPWALEVLEPGGTHLTLGDVATSLYEIDFNLGDYFSSLQRMTPPDSDFDDTEIDQVLGIDVQSAVDGHAGCYEKASAARDDVVLCTVGPDILVGLSRGGYWSTDHLAFQSGGRNFFVDHVATTQHAAAIIERAKANNRSSLTARSFWDAKAAAFPNLTFGAGVESDLRKFSAKMLRLLFNRLADLDGRVQRWRDNGAFPDDAMPPITGESAPTMAQFGNARKFKDETGDVVVFEDHIWVDSLHRIHLIKDIDARLIKIGYIGRHLPTVTHRT